MTDLSMLDLRSSEAWRAWLKEHHASSPGVWLVFYKGPTAVRSIPYEDAVCQALCFGWVDSLVRRLDVERYARKFTPRKPTSKWSAINRRRWAKLKEHGLLAGPGLGAAPTDARYAKKPVIPRMPAYIRRAFKARPRAWRFFQALAPSYRRHFVAWIHTAKRAETREKRIRDSIALLEAGRKLGLK